MRQVTPRWKLVTAIFSLLLTVLVWQKGLEESFSRPSVAPKLSLRQHEMALLASPVFPESIKFALVGDNPEIALKKILEEIPSKDIEDRERLVLASLEQTETKRAELLKFDLTDQTLEPLKRVLFDTSSFSRFSSLDPLFVQQLKNDPLLYQVSCRAFGGNEDLCINFQASNSMALKLLGIQLLPLLATSLGVILLIRQGWLIVRNRNNSWPELSNIPLSLIDMTLLISGGFVVLGEVLLPALIIPLSSYLSNGLSSPISESFRVFVGYTLMTIPPLLILRQQLTGLKNLEMPNGGWLQWGIRPVDSSLLKAVGGWLMIMPFVLLTGWLMNMFFGDQGGSNPLLDLVLSSHNKIALSLLLLTTVILAPAFEELIFRGVLLPVLALKFGRLGGIVISAFVFALAHLSVGELAPLFVLGVGLGILRLNSGRLFSCALMHSLWNGITFANLLLLAP